MKKTIIVLLLLINLIGFGQQNTFNKVYNPYNNINTYSYGNGIQKKGNGYIIVASSEDSIVYLKRNVLFNEFDSVGNLIKTTTFARNAYNFFGGGNGSLIQTSDSGYFIPCSFTNNDTNMNHYLIRFDSNMDTLWTKTYNNASIWEIFRQPCETYDKGFACVGYRVVTNTIFNVLLVKFDSLGNKLWDKTISLGNRSYGNQIKETPDKGFLICGYRINYIDNYLDPFLIKTDSIGNVLWSRVFGAQFLSNSNASFDITSEGDYLFAYGHALGGQLNPTRIKLYKINPNGYNIWNKTIDTIRVSTSVEKIQILPNNDFLIIGVNGTSHFVYEENYTYVIRESYIFRLNSTGDSIYRKSYNYSNYISNSNNNIFNDIYINQDGSMMLIGTVSVDTMQPYQKIWFVKADSNGYAPGCNSTGVEEFYYTQSGEIKIFPNPATTQTTITYLIAEKGITLQIYNTLGQLVYEEKLAKGSSQTTVDTRAYKRGLYKVVVGESNKSLLIQ